MYATKNDMILAFGERECISLTDTERLGKISEAVMDAALMRASAEIDGYLVARYRTPFTDTARILIGRCCDITRYHLATAHRLLKDEIRLRYEDAVRFLEKVAEGRIGLGRTDSGQVIQSSPQMRFGSSDRQFGRNSTGGGAF